MVKLSDFIGKWRLEREITHQGGARAEFLGHADWSPIPEGALYVEAGELHIPGQGRFQSERRYIWHSDLRIFFDDGRYFHTVPAAGGGSAHWCDPDHYHADYTFTDWPSWRCRWQVKGPRKDYVMTSTYQPEE